MLVTRIIGKCPGCGVEASYGNVHISNNWLLRGCTRCTYSEEIPLPPLSKEVLYLDQFFFSHAFRAQLPEFVSATEIISNLAHKQLIVCPYSRTHEIETNLWTNQNELLEFIKDISRGHEFWPYYRINETQIFRGFERFLRSEKDSFPLKISDAIPDDINDWEDYFRIEVTRPPIDSHEIRSLKKESVRKLVELFPSWRLDSTTFEEDRATEIEESARIYVHSFLNMMSRLEKGDFDALIDSPVDTNIVESILQYNEKTIEFTDRMERINQFFQSLQFAEIPYEFISTGLFTVLKKRVKQGHYKNPRKARERLSGFLYDVEFISAYAPYCHAMFLDNAMADFVNDPDLRLSERYGTRFFSRSNWGEFLEYLEAVESKNSIIFDQAENRLHFQRALLKELMS